MSAHRRPRATGANIFFTVALAERGNRLLCDEVLRLRKAEAFTRHERPFGIKAWVVLTDHLLCIWTLSIGDRDFSMRWRRIKARLSRDVAAGERRRSHLAR